MPLYPLSTFSTIVITTLFFLTPTLTASSTPPALNITAITAANNASILQCWRLSNFSISNTPGTIGALNLNLGDVSNASYTVIPARTNAGLHRAPSEQFVIFLTGLAHITLPNSTSTSTSTSTSASASSEEAWIVGGKYGLIYAADTADRSALGHNTEYPSGDSTIAISVPVAPGMSLVHEVLHQGGCGFGDVSGL